MSTADVIRYVLYTALIIFILSRWKKVHETGLAFSLITGVFILRLITGTAFKIYTERTMQGGDLHRNNELGWVEYRFLMESPWAWFREFFTNYRWHFGNFFASRDSFWNDIGDNVLMKLLAIFNIFTRGNYHVNNLLMQAIALAGCVLFFLSFKKMYKAGTASLFTGAFLLPSMLLFTSGVHKETLMFFLLGVFIYALTAIRFKGITSSRVIGALVSFLLMALIRNFLGLLLVAALVPYFISVYKNIKPARIFTIWYGAAILFVAALQAFHPSIKPVSVLAAKQMDYFLWADSANTAIRTDTLQHTNTSALRILPEAIKHGFAEPNFIEQNKMPLLPFSIEWSSYMLLFCLALFMAFKNSNPIIKDPFFWLSLCFAFSLFLIIGFTINNLGSIVRYRSTLLPLLITPLLLIILKKQRR